MQWANIFIHNWCHFVEDVRDEALRTNLPDVLPPSLTVSCPWVLSYLKRSGDIHPELPNWYFFVDGKSGIFRINGYLTITDWAALVWGLNGVGAGQDRTDDRIADDGPLLQEESLVLHSGINTQTPHVQTQELLAPLSLPGSYRRNTCRSLESSGSRERDAGSRRNRSAGLFSAPPCLSRGSRQTPHPRPPPPWSRTHRSLAHGSVGKWWKGLKVKREVRKLLDTPDSTPVKLTC